MWKAKVKQESFNALPLQVKVQNVKKVNTPSCNVIATTVVGECENFPTVMTDLRYDGLNFFRYSIDNALVHFWILLSFQKIHLVHYNNQTSPFFHSSPGYDDFRMLHAPLSSCYLLKKLSYLKSFECSTEEWGNTIGIFQLVAIKISTKPVKSTK